MRSQRGRRRGRHRKKSSKRGLILLGLAFIIPILVWLAATSFKPQSDLEEVCEIKGIPYPLENVNIVVSKSKRELYLYSGDELIKTYPVLIGRDAVNDKVRRDDNRTPVGEFYVCEKSTNPGKKHLGTRWMRLSYPNKEDAERGVQTGLIDKSIAKAIEKAVDGRKTPPQDTPLGSGIGIHGGKFGRLYTAGCISLRDEDIEEFYGSVQIGTKVVIRM